MPGGVTLTTAKIVRPGTLKHISFFRKCQKHDSFDEFSLCFLLIWLQTLLGARLTALQQVKVTHTHAYKPHTLALVLAHASEFDRLLDVSKLC